jgi:phosphatidate cytidylyltransferase
VGLLWLDGWLAVHPPGGGWVIAGGIDLAPWLFVGAPTTLLSALFAYFTTRELVAMARILGYSPSPRTAGVFSILLVLAPYVTFHVLGRCAGEWSLFAAALVVGFAFLSQASRYGTAQTLANTSVTFLVAFYGGGLMSFFVRLRLEVGGTAGVWFLILSILTLKANDIGAYFTGMAVGRHKMIEWLSPKKTWEGFVGGLALALIVAAVGGTALWVAKRVSITGHPIGDLWIFALFGLVMGLVSVGGDLAASLLKRDAKLKDSSSAIPGMGGVLDVADSLLFGAPLAWLFWSRIVTTLTT